jgi:hypothetical protein
VSNRLASGNQALTMAGMEIGRNESSLQRRQAAWGMVTQALQAARDEHMQQKQLNAQRSAQRAGNIFGGIGAATQAASVGVNAYDAGMFDGEFVSQGAGGASSAVSEGFFKPLSNADFG